MCPPIAHVPPPLPPPGAEAGGTDDPIPLPNVSGPILTKVLEYCSYHANVEGAAHTEDEMKEWDDAFARVDQPVLFELILAANFLNVRSLLDLTCKTVADMIKGKSPEEIRQVLNIQNDFSPEEEEEVRRENAWAFE